MSQLDDIQEELRRIAVYMQRMNGRLSAVERRDQFPSSSFEDADGNAVMLADVADQTSDQGVTVSALDERLAAAEAAVVVAGRAADAAAELGAAAGEDGQQAAADAAEAADDALAQAEVAKENAEWADARAQDALAAAAGANDTAGQARQDAADAVNAAAAAHDLADQARADADTAVQRADDAKTAADAARGDASDASQKALDAQAAAASAVQAAADANAAAGQAGTKAQSAFDAAAVKSKVIVQVSAPTGANADPQNLWIDISADANGVPRNRPNRYNTSTSKWEPITDLVASLASSTATSALQNAAAADQKAVTAQTKATDAATAAADAAKIAGGKADVLIQSATPDAAYQKATTLWIDTTSGANTPKRWGGSTWNIVTDKAAVDAANAAATAKTAADAAKAQADTALAAAGTAQTTADGKGKTIVQVSAPTGANATAANLWIDISTDSSGNPKNTPNRYNPATSKWEPITDLIAQNAATVAASAAAAAVTAQQTADTRTRVLAGPGAPTANGLAVGDLWFTIPNTTTGIITGQYRWDGSAWKQQTVDSAVLASVDAGKITSGYIAAARIQAGTITATMIAGDTITAAQIAANAITASELAANAVTAGKIAAGTIVANDIAAGAITGDRLTAGTIGAGQIAAGAITTVKLAAGAVTASELAAGSVVAGKIASGTIVAGDIAAGAITGDRIAANTITTRSLIIGSADNLVDDPYFDAGFAAWDITGSTTLATDRPYMGHPNTAKIVNSGAVAGKMLPVTPGAQYAFSVAYYTADWNGGSGGLRLEYSTNGTTWTNFVSTNLPAATTGAWRVSSGSGAVPANAAYIRARVAFAATGTVNISAVSLRAQATGELIVDGAITTDKIIAAAITGAKIAADTITAANIAAGAVQADEIAANAVVAEKIAANAITAAHISAGAIQTDDLAANVVTAAKIAAATITAAQIASGTISTDNLAAGAVTAAKIAAATITGDQIAASTITGAHIVANTITAADIAAATITGSLIAASTITAGNLAADSVTAAKIAADAVLARNIKAGEVTAGKLAASSVVAANIVAGTITGDRMAANSITSREILAGSVTADSLAANAIDGKTITGPTIRSAASGSRIELVQNGKGGVPQYSAGALQFVAPTNPSYGTETALVMRPGQAAADGPLVFDLGTVVNSQFNYDRIAALNAYVPRNADPYANASSELVQFRPPDVASVYAPDTSGPQGMVYARKAVFDSITSYTTGRQMLGDTGRQIATLLNGWGPGTAGLPPRYRLFNGWVVLSGFLQSTSTSGTGIFQLPVGYRPLDPVRFIVPDNNSASTTTVTVSTSGVVAAPTGSRPVLDPVQFIAGQ